MKKNLLFTCMFFLLLLTAKGQIFEWAKRQSNYPPAITTDGTNLYSAGRYSGPITLGNQTFTNSGCYLAKHDPSGSVLWAKKLVGVYENVSIHADASNNIIIAGYFTDSLYIDGLLFKNDTMSTQWNYYQNFFVAKLTPAGTVLWAREAKQPAYNTKISTDGAGNIFVTGTYGSLTISNTTITALGQSDVFLVKYDTNGNFQWLKSSGTPNYDQTPNVQAGLNGESYLKYLSHWGSGNGLKFTLKKYSAAGVEEWERLVYDAFSDGLALDGAGNIYLSGTGTSYLAVDTIEVPVTTNPNQNTIFLAKISPAGTWKWARVIVPGTYWATAVKLGNMVNNSFSISGSFSGTATFGSKSFTTDGYERYIAKIDTAGNLFKANTIKRDQVDLYFYELHSGIATSQSGETYLSGAFGGPSMPVNGNVYFGPYILSPQAQIFGTQTYFSENNGYLTKVNHHTNDVSGTVFIDSNGNGLKDSGEIPFANCLIGSTPGQEISYTNSSGTYSLNLPAGAYTVNVLQPAAHYTISPPNQSVSFAGSGQTINRDFALMPIPNRHDVKVAVTAITPARPGFNFKYRLTFENVGTTTISDTVSLYFNSSQLTFLNATTPGLQQTGKLSWYYAALQPRDKRNINIEFAVNTNTPLNSSLTAFAVIKPVLSDFNTSNNYDSLTHVVVGSFDPNDKQVNLPALTTGQVAAGHYLEYTVRFQNTGNYQATTVFIRDSINAKWQMSSFEILASSHNYTYQVFENGTMEWRFNNINLPASSQNEPASHGFIRYRIKPKNNLVLGDEIKSRAAIYFDFNSPVMTNYATTRIQNPTGIKEKNIGLAAFNLYPNPAKEFVMVEAELISETAITLKLTDVLGRQIFEKQYAKSDMLQQRIETGNLTKGVYLLSLQTEKGIITKRLVIE